MSEIDPLYGMPSTIYKGLEEKSLRFSPGLYHEDNEFTPRAYYYAEKVASINDIIYLVVQTPSSITRTPNPKRGYDLLKIIDMLVEFAETKVEEQYRPYIYKQVSDCINSGIRLVRSLPEDTKAALKTAIFEKKELFGYYKKSSAITHRIEGMIFGWFPKRYSFLYDILDHLRQ